MKTLDNIKKELNFTLTENLDIAYKSTFDENLDLFGMMGAMRYNSDDFMTLFIRAYNENQELAIRNLFYLRDVRGGMGERNNFRLGIKWLSENYSNKLINIKMPEIVFWNVDARSIHFPTTDKDNVKLISGYSNYVLQDILKDITTDPIEFMMETLDKYKEVFRQILDVRCGLPRPTVSPSMKTQKTRSYI